VIVAVEERPSSWQTTTEPIHVGKLVRELEKLGLVVASDSPEQIKKVELMSVERQRFDKTFVWDIAIPMALFVAAIICVEFRLPVIGNPLSLLIGPVIGLILALIHRPPR